MNFDTRGCEPSQALVLARIPFGLSSAVSWVSGANLQELSRMSSERC